MPTREQYAEAIQRKLKEKSKETGPKNSNESTGDDKWSTR